MQLTCQIDNVLITLTCDNYRIIDSDVIRHIVLQIASHSDNLRHMSSFRHSNSIRINTVDII